MECGRGFIQKQVLQRYERFYKGLKLFICKICYKFYGDVVIIRKYLIFVYKINKDFLKWKEDIIQNEFDSLFVVIYEFVDQSYLERNEIQILIYNIYEGNDMILIENINEMQLLMVIDYNVKFLLIVFSEDLLMLILEVYYI